MLKRSSSTSSSNTNSSILNSKFSSEENESQTPQNFWLNSFLRKSGNGFGIGGFSSENDFKTSLMKDLAQAMETFSVDKFRNDYYFLLIWLSYIKLQL